MIKLSFLQEGGGYSPPSLSVWVVPAFGIQECTANTYYSEFTETGAT